MTTLRRALTEDEYYFFSSYYESWLASRPSFADIVDRDRLRIVFGHYCHETLLRVFGHRPIFLFTGLRDPLACAISGYRQVNAVCAQAGRPPIAAETYMETHANPMCAEILRCFPSLDLLPGAVWQRARAALSLFDLIYATEAFDQHVGTILAVLDVHNCVVTSDNVSGQRAVAADAASFIEDGCRLIIARGRDFLDQDAQLYEAMTPYFGRPWMRRTTACEAWSLDRDAFIATLPAADEALRVFCARERDFLVHEFDQLGRLTGLRADLMRKSASLATVLRRIEEYTS